MENRIETTTNKWFVETVSKVNAEITTDTPVDNVLSGVVPLAHNYCNAVFLLANNNHRLPAMALLRILGELALRVTWCMYGDNPKKEPLDVRIMRWLKTTNLEERKILEKLLPSVSPEEATEIKRTIQYLNDEIDENPHKFISALYNSLDELPPPYKEKIYRVLYLEFNRAVHPNLKLLYDLVRQEDRKRMFSSDLEQVDTEVLKIYCMTQAFNVLAVTRVYYDWDYKGMKSEYLAIKKDFASRQKE